MGQWGRVWEWKLTEESKGVPPTYVHLSVECRCFLFFFLHREKEIEFCVYKTVKMMEGKELVLALHASPCASTERQTGAESTFWGKCLAPRRLNKSSWVLNHLLHFQPQAFLIKGRCELIKYERSEKTLFIQVQWTDSLPWAAESNVLCPSSITEALTWDKSNRCFLS